MEETELMEQCPRWNYCSVPKCPLDPLIDKRVKLQGDPSCTLAKSIRTRIAKGSELPYQGMTKKEWSATQQFKQGKVSKKFLEQGEKVRKKEINLRR